MSHGPRVLTPAYYERLYALEEGHGWFRGMRAAAGALLAPLLRDGSGRRILDAGCGTGSMLDWLRRRFRDATLIGIDVSPDALDFCRRRGHRSLAEGSVLSLPFRAESFDLVVCTDVLQHLPDPPGDSAALSEAYRVLRPGGYLYVRTNSARDRPRHPDAGPADYRRYTRQGLSEQVRAAGFAVERATHANSLPSAIGRAGRRLRAPATHAHTADAGLSVQLRPPRLRWLDDGLALLLWAESWYIRLPRRSLPFGSSLLILAHKPERGPTVAPARSQRETEDRRCP